MANEIDIKISVTGSPDAVRAIQGIRTAAVELQQAGGAAVSRITATAQAAGPAIVDLGGHTTEAAAALNSLEISGRGAGDAMVDVVPKSLPADLRKASVNVEELAGHLSRVGQGLTVGVSLPLAAVGGASIKMAMDAVESESLFSVSMGKQADSARTWSEQLRTQLGLNAYAVREQVGTFNVMFTSMKFGESAALNMSEGLTKLAYDMASFYNLDTNDALQKLQAGITGETEPLKRLGILIDENTVKTYAYQHGLAETGSALSEQQKVMARYGAIMDQTSKAQGDLARTIDSPANQLRILKGQLAEVSIELGNELIPVMKEATSVIIPLVHGAGDLIEEFGELPEWIQDTVLATLGFGVAVGPAIYATTNLVSVLGSAKKAYLALREAQLVAKVSTIAGELGAVGGVVAIGAPLALGLGALAGHFVDVGRAAEEAGRKAKASADDFRLSVSAMGKDATSAQLTIARAEYLDFGSQIENLKKRKKDFEDAAKQGGDVGTVSAYRQQARDLGSEIEGLQAKMEAAASKMRDAKQHLLSFSASTPPGKGDEGGGGGGGGDGGLGTPLQTLKSDTSSLLGNYEQLKLRGLSLVDVWREMVQLQERASDLAKQQGGALTGEAGAVRADALQLQTRLHQALTGLVTPSVAVTRNDLPPSAGPMVLHQVSAGQYPAPGQAPVTVAAKDFDQAGQIAIASLGAMAAAAVSGTEQMTAVVIGGFTQIATAAATQLGGGVWGAAVGAVGGLLGALFGRRSQTQPMPVSVEQYGSKALSQQKKDGPDVIRVLLVDSTTGEQTELLGYELGRAERRDAIVRVPRKAGR